MAQQFIKIFDNTVLKQSINQGYETQRTNTRLGKFTMGELAFTRDTARVFVGNFTDLNLPKDSSFVTGGSLVGNKYLGIIDSKPLTHFSSTTETLSSAMLPLNYEYDTTFVSNIKDENGISKTYKENAILLKDSKFRNDSNSGWNKQSTYNEKYDAYNGDYLYDVYNNALILFDTNIKPIEATEKANWTIDPTTNEQKFYIDDDKNLGTYTEEGSKDNYSTKRTRIHNVKKPTTDVTDYTTLGNSLYPIYGDGYVVMRILEPDGITLGYKERSFDQATGIPTDGNYSHNYLEIKSIPIDTIYHLFDPKYFTVKITDDTQRHITFTGNVGDITANSIKGEKGFISISPIINFSKENTEGDIIKENKINFLFENIDDINTKYLCLTENRDEDFYQASIQESPKLKIVYKDLVKSVTLSPGSTNEINLNPSISLSLNGRKVYDPFFISIGDVIEGETATADMYYSSSNIFSSDGSLVSTEEIPNLTKETEGEYQGKIKITPENYHSYFVLYDSSGEESYYKIIQEESTDDEGVRILDSNFEGALEHPYVNVGLNHLKNPLPIAWGADSSEKVSSCAKFFINPYVISPSCSNGGHKNIGVIGSVSPSINVDSEWTTSTIEALMDQADGQNVLFDGSTTGAHIPDHAQSVICEMWFHKSDSTLLNNPKCSIVTNGNYKSLNSNIGNINFNTSPFSLISNTSIPSTDFTSAWNDTKHVCQLCISDDVTVQTFELPLYRDKNAMKFFNLGVIYQCGEFVIRIIGYRA